jgi:hypothetical protein
MTMVSASPHTLERGYRLAWIVMDKRDHFSPRSFHSLRDGSLYNFSWLLHPQLLGQLTTFSMRKDGCDRTGETRLSLFFPKVQPRFIATLALNT